MSSEPALLYAKAGGIATLTMSFKEKRKPVFHGR